MQNTTIICKIKFDFIYWSNMTKNRNNAFHIDTFTSGDKISPIGSSHDKTVYMPCSIKSLTKRMDSVFRPKIFVSSVFVISFFPSTDDRTTFISNIYSKIGQNSFSSWRLFILFLRLVASSILHTCTHAHTYINPKQSMCSTYITKYGLRRLNIFF